MRLAATGIVALFILATTLAVACSSGGGGESAPDLGAATDVPAMLDSVRVDISPLPLDTGETPEDGAVASPDTGAVLDVALLDVPVDTGGPFVLPEGLNGEQAADFLATVSFEQVLDHTGAAVSPEDLIGHPTVLWFYPMANTPV